MIKIKVCGLTDQKQASWCEDLGVEFIGFIFHPSSSRYIRPESAAAVRTGSPVRVGVFVHQDLDEVEWIMKTARLDLAQLHGGQDLDFCRRIGRKRVVKVLWPEKISSNKELVKEMDRFSEACSWFLLDGGFSGGGHGRTLEWSSFADIHPPRPWLLAGGLGPGNVSDALRVCHPDGVDLNSGVENSPGKKDSSKLKSCIQAIRSFSS